MFLNEGTLLKGGTYKIIRFIASGGFGCTYEAVHLMLNKRVAIKEFFPKTFCNRDNDTHHVTVGTLSQQGLVKKLKFKFVNEAQSIAKLSHPSIIKVSDVFEENGTAYYVMDYIEGKSLGKIVEEKGQLSEKEALGYIRQICDALEYVHDQNRLHLDIKPGNIMVDSYDHAILIDFGASKQYDEENGENTSTLIGKTPGFAPIEQMGNDVSHFRPATDIYSLGATLYKCLSGKIPIEPNLRVQGEELEALPSDISESTKKAVEAAMELNPKKRPQTVKDFVSILNQPNPNSQIDEGTKYNIPVKNVPLSNTTKSVNKSDLSEFSKHSNQIKESKNSSNLENSSNYEDPTKVEKIKSPKINVIIGVSAAIIIALICWMVFSKDIVSVQQNEEVQELATVDNSLTNSILEGSSQAQGAEPVSNLADAQTATFEIVPPTNVKVGEEFKVVYRLSNGKGVDFKVKDIKECVKLSGPMISETKNGLDYVYTYKAEKEGSYIIPSATINLDGRILTSNSYSLSASSPQSQIIPEEISANQFTDNTTTLSQNNIVDISGNINGHDYVDLGLPSGLKWATCNIGASRPEDYGSYFAWGEIATKSEYTENNSESFGKDIYELRKHGFLQSNWNLAFSNDVARQKWGSSWRMPTLQEIKELFENNNTSTENTTRNGVKGTLVKSKKNGNTIFLPWGGVLTDSGIIERGVHGVFWSTQPTEGGSETAYYMGCNSEGLGYKWQYRWVGESVRPVSK